MTDLASRKVETWRAFRAALADVAEHDPERALAWFDAQTATLRALACELREAVPTPEQGAVFD